MRRLPFLVLAASLALGCDDPDVEATLVGALEHGAVVAAVDCFVDPPTAFVTNPDGRGISVRLFLDGSMFFELQDSPSRATLAARYLPRGYEQEVRIRDAFAGEDTRDFVGGGFWTTQITDGGGSLDNPPFSLSFPYEWVHVALDDVDCSGFNLEAFGVE